MLEEDEYEEVEVSGSSEDEEEDEESKNMELEILRGKRKTEYLKSQESKVIRNGILN